MCSSYSWLSYASTQLTSALPVWSIQYMCGLCRTNDGTQRFILVPIAESGAPSGQYQYAPNQTYPRSQNKANATSYVIPFPLSQVSVLYNTWPCSAQVLVFPTAMGHKCLDLVGAESSTLCLGVSFPRLLLKSTPETALCLLSCCHGSIAHAQMSQHRPLDPHGLCQQTIMCQ